MTPSGPTQDMNDQERQARRVVFNDVAPLYDRVRPSYPDKLFDQLFTWMGQKPQATHLLEVGPGTGKATLPLLKRGCTVTAVELGPDMAEHLRKRAASYGRHLQVIVGAFEQVALPHHQFDAVLAASAWHWVEPRSGLRIAHGALRMDGVIALLSIMQVRDGGPDFFEASQAIYETMGLQSKAWDPAQPRESAVNADVGLLEQSPLFSDPSEFRVPWNVTYTSAQYVQLKQTHSDTLLLDANTRSEFLRRTAALIDEEFGGSIVRPGIASLVLARAV
jgi:SAM-dependent methyltransferase